MKIVVLGNQARSVVNFWTVLMRHALSAGHTVICLVPFGDEASDSILSERCSKLCHYHLSRKGLNPFVDCCSFLELFHFFRTEKPDLLFTSTIKPVIYGSIAASLAGVPHIFATITGLGYTFEADTPAKRLIRRLSIFLYRLALGRVEGVFFQNRDDEAVFASFGIITDTTRVLHAKGTGVDTKRFAYMPLPPTREGELVFLFIGRLLIAKGLEDYVEAARSLKKRYPRAEFRILGPVEPGLGGVPEDELSSWQKEGVVDWLGVTDDVRPFLADCHVLVLPSYREGTPTVVMEAMSTGRASIVTDAPGCREVVRPSVNGLMVPVRNPTALASAMETFLTDPDLCSQMGSAARRLAETEFDADLVAEQILAAMSC